MTDVDATMADLRSRIAQLAADGSRTARADAKIGDAAHQRYSAVSSEIEALRPKAMTDPAAAERYQALISERGRLNLVIGQSRGK